MDCPRCGCEVETGATKSLEYQGAVVMHQLAECFANVKAERDKLKGPREEEQPEPKPVAERSAGPFDAVGFEAPQAEEEEPADDEPSEEERKQEEAAKAREADEQSRKARAATAAHKAKKK